jgi:hypothetical protein
MANHKRKLNHKKDSLLKGWLLNLMVSSPAIIALGLILATQGSLTSQRLGLSFFLAGFTGVIVIIRKESPMSIGSLRGKSAIWLGVLFTAVCWGLALYMWLSS